TVASLNVLRTGQINHLACWGGYQYRRIWKTGGRMWKLWLYGVLAASCLLILAFAPLSEGG
ncbi:MAG: hypothetical protein AAF317_14005, partial [Pseudomonadota bacterium]